MPPHFDTPRKAQIRGAAKFLEFLERKQGRTIVKRKLVSIAECFETSEKQVSAILRSKRIRRTPEVETRGGTRRLDREKIKKATGIIKTNKLDGRDDQSNKDDQVQHERVYLHGTAEEVDGSLRQGGDDNNNDEEGQHRGHTTESEEDEDEDQ
ncbi:Hypothetical predicted protein [Lecanosticta acicola]|uniref:Uncharacterized protein n=1 Tax=Lecanosticta acicola TaxID=111012 RepID=A0AAI9EC98_9PEZI|nr:Hypothetical predicted protein [Lecanosticta acicola]